MKPESFNSNGLLQILKAKRNFRKPIGTCQQDQLHRLIDGNPVLLEPHNKSLRLEEFRLRLDEFRNAETTAERLGSSPALKREMSLGK